jgi:hypothetical protein
MAGAQLGSFTYDMVLNYAKFEDAFTKAQRIADQHANAIKKSIEKAVDGAGDAFGDLAGKVVAAFSIEKLVEFGKQAIETADQMGKAAQKVGSSVESLSALAVQAKLSDVALDELQGGMEKLAKNAAAAAAGNKQAAAGFAAIGVSLKDSNGNLKSTDLLLEDVAKKFTGYADGASKTALAQELFGKAGANLIPMLNELGEKGLAGVTKQAEQFGAVISGDAAKAANEFNDSITILGIEAGGFAQMVTQKALPALNYFTGALVEYGKQGETAKTASDGIANAIKGVIVAALGIKEVIYGATTVIIGLYDAVKLTFSSAGEIINAWADATGKAIKSAFHFDKQGIDDANAQFNDAFQKIGTNFVKESAKIKGAMSGGIGEAAANIRTNFDALFNSIGNVGKGADETGDHLKKLNAPLVANTAASDAAKAADERLQQMFYKDAEVIEKLSGKFGPLQKMYAEYKDTIIAANAAYQSEIVEAGKSTDQAHALAAAKAILTAKTQAAFQALQQETLQFVKANDAVQKYFDKVSDERALIGLTDRQKEISQAIQEQVRWWENLTEAQQKDYDRLGILNPTLQTTQDRIAGVTGALYDQKKAAELNTQAAHEWQSIWSSAGNSLADTFAKVLVEGGSLFDGLKNLAKQAVEQIIAYFAKLAIINPILNSIFGGGGGMGSGFSLLPTMANAFGGGGGGGAAINAAVSGGGAQNVLADGGAAASGGAGGASFFSPTNWVTAGKNLFNGFFGTGNAFAGATAGGSFVGGGGTGVFAGANAGGTMSYVPQYGGYGSALGQGLGIAGGVYAGYNEYKSAGRGAAGVVGGLAYGIGTITAGGAIAGGLGAIGGGAAAAGAGAAAGGSAAAAGIGVIPVIGWIALAAMLVNMISGGKLFGTAWQAKASTTSLAIGPNGGDASASIYETKQGALFSGLKKRNKSVDPGQDARDAAQSLFDSVEKIMIQAAHQMQTDVPPVISAALEVVNTYDKKGKVKSTKYVVDILGKKYEEASQELAATRISAEAIVATVAASEAGKAASAIAEQWRKSADTLMDGAQFLVAATADLTKGTNLLGDGGTLTQIADVVTDLQQGGEKLVETYVRLSAQTKIIQQAFELAHVSIGKTGEELVRFADSAAQAAGGADQLTQLIQQFNQAYFSAAEVAQQGIDQLRKASNSALSAIGEDPAETMAKFKSDFLSALPSLTPEQLVKWYAAGVALATYTGAVTDSANQLLNAKEQYAQFEAQLYGDNFISSFSSVIAAEQQQIDTANQLAKAAGLAGASQEDLARITAQGTAAVRKAIADLTTGIQSDIVSLFGASQVGYDSNNPFGPQYQQSQQAQQDQANAARISNAYDLIEKLGDYAFASGKTIDDVLKLFPGLSIDQIGGAAGITADDTRKQIQAAEDNAAALTNMLAQGDEQTGLLANILATLQGNALPYDVSRLGAPPAVDLTSSAPLSKGGNQVGSPNTAKDMKAAIQDGSKPAVDEQKRTNDLLEKLVFALTGQRVNTNRNTAGRAGNFLPA